MGEGHAIPAGEKLTVTDVRETRGESAYQNLAWQSHGGGLTGMSRKYWFPTAAGGAILALLLLVALPVHQYHQHWDREHQSAYQAGDLRHALDRCAQMAGLADRAACQLEAIEADRQARQTAYAAKTQQHVATFTMGIMLAGAIGLTLSGFGVILIYLTLKETRSLTHETRRIGEAQVRAYADVKKATVALNADGTARVAVQCTNTGQSPAYDVVASVSLNMGSPLHVYIGTIAAQSSADSDISINKHMLIEAFDDGKSSNTTMDMVLFYKDVFREGTLKEFNLHLLNMSEVRGRRKISVQRVVTPMKHFVDARMEHHERAYSAWIDSISRP